MKSRRRSENAVLPAADAEAAMARRPRRCLLVFTRYPEPGVTKTRMIPALGAEGAARLQRDMTAHTLAVARAWRRETDDHVVVLFTGGSEVAMAETFGPDLQYTPQTEGNLGERLHHAFAQAHNAGFQRIAAIGSDCPSIDGRLLDQAFGALTNHDAVMGPAVDGGYYLIALQSPQPELFQEIAWGTDKVLEQSLTAMERLKLRVLQLDRRSDVDEPADLPIWEAVRASSAHPSLATPRLSVIIPTLNEEENLLATLASIGDRPEVEIIVADGGSGDRTRAIAGACGARVVVSDPGRAKQMNAGAAAASGPALLFLHADTHLPNNYLDAVETCLENPRVVAGVFRFALDDARLSLRIIARFANLRARWLHSPYGDQALFLRREVFERSGGFQDIPVMEDHELIQRLRKSGTIAMLPQSVITSSRRWLARGVWRTTLVNACILAGWRLGIAPIRLARWRTKWSGGPRPTPSLSKTLENGS